MSVCMPKSVSIVNQFRVDFDVEGVTLVTLSGEIDLSSTPGLNRVFDELDGDRRVVVDCSDVPFMDCSGLRILLRYTARAKAAGGSLHVRNPSVQVDRLLHLASLDDLLDT